MRRGPHRAAATELNPEPLRERVALLLRTRAGAIWRAPAAANQGQAAATHVLRVRNRQRLRVGRGNRRRLLRNRFRKKQRSAQREHSSTLFNIGSSYSNGPYAVANFRTANGEHKRNGQR